MGSRKPPTSHLQSHNCPAKHCNWAVRSPSLSPTFNLSINLLNLGTLPYQIQKSHHSNHHPPHFAESLSKLSAGFLSSHMRLQHQSSPIILGLGNDASAPVAQLDVTIERFPPNHMIEAFFSSNPRTCKRVMTLLPLCPEITQSPFSFFCLPLVKLCACRQPVPRFCSGTRSC